MPIHLEITDRSGYQEVTSDRDTIWLGSLKSGCNVEVDLPGCHGRVLEIKVADDGPMIRAEAGIPFPIRSVTGNVGTRFETLLDGDVLNVGPAMVKVRVTTQDPDAEVRPPKK